MLPVIIVPNDHTVCFQYVRLPIEHYAAELGAWIVLDGSALEIAFEGQVYHLLQQGFDSMALQQEAINTTTGDIIVLDFEATH